MPRLPRGCVYECVRATMDQLVDKSGVRCFDASQSCGFTHGYLAAALGVVSEAVRHEIVTHDEARELRRRARAIDRQAANERKGNRP